MVRLKRLDFWHLARKFASFQFLYGTIKTIISRKGCVNAINFNSSMVRLKLFTLPIEWGYGLRFQFLYGTIKTKDLRDMITGINDFNSSMVRLKPGVDVQADRLEIFQFLYGTIKTGSTWWSSFKRVLFQFLYGTIKTAARGGKRLKEFYFNSSMVRLKR